MYSIRIKEQSEHSGLCRDIRAVLFGSIKVSQHKMECFSSRNNAPHLIGIPRNPKISRCYKASIISCKVFFLNLNSRTEQHSGATNVWSK